MLHLTANKLMLWNSESQTEVFKVGIFLLKIENVVFTHRKGDFIHKYQDLKNRRVSLIELIDWRR